MEWFVPALFFWMLFYLVVYLVSRHLDTDDYTRKQVDIPEETDHIYLRQEAYNRYTNDEYGNF